MDSFITSSEEEEFQQAVAELIKAGLVELITNTDTGKESFVLTEKWNKIQRIITERGTH